MRVQAAGAPSPSPRPSPLAGARETTEAAPIGRAKTYPRKPLKGEGQCCRADGAQYLPLLAPWWGKVRMGERTWETTCHTPRQAYPGAYAMGGGKQGCCRETFRADTSCPPRLILALSRAVLMAGGSPGAVNELGTGSRAGASLLYV